MKWFSISGATKMASENDLQFKKRQNKQQNKLKQLKKNKINQDIFYLFTISYSLGNLNFKNA